MERIFIFVFSSHLYCLLLFFSFLCGSITFVTSFLLVVTDAWKYRECSSRESTKPLAEKSWTRGFKGIQADVMICFDDIKH